MASHRILRRYFGLVLLALVAVAAFLDARGIVQLAVARLAPEAEALAAPPNVVARAAPPGDEPRTTSADTILARNPFDHATSLLPIAAYDEGTSTAAGVLDPRDAPKCDGVRVLVITASTDPDWSFVALSSAEDPHAVLRRRGGALGKKTVHFIGWDRVWFEESAAGSEALCQAELFTPASEAKPATPIPAKPVVNANAPPANPLVAEILRGIARVGATEFAVDRGVLEKILENQHLFMGTTRIQPESVNGRVAGIKLFGVKQGTLLGALGLEDGDRLDTINGFDMSSPESALQAYARLRGAEHLTLNINRGGRDMTMDYAIR